MSKKLASTKKWGIKSFWEGHVCYELYYYIIIHHQRRNEFSDNTDILHISTLSLLQTNAMIDEYTSYYHI